MPRGAYVYKILESGAAASSELWEKDIITKLAGYRAGEQVELTVQRQIDGVYQELTVTVTLAAMPAEEQETASGQK